MMSADALGDLVLLTDTARTSDPAVFLFTNPEQHSQSDPSTVMLLAMWADAPLLATNGGSVALKSPVRTPFEHPDNTRSSTVEPVPPVPHPYR